MKRYNFLFLFILFLNVPFVAQAKKLEIKLSILAPEGTTWMNIMHAFNKELKEKTKGEVQFKIYAGGAFGDELDVVRKMRLGQVHAAGFTGVGLGQILKEVRVLELPFIFSAPEEVDYVTSNLTPYFEKEFEKKGYVFLGFAEAGFVNVFSAKPVKSQADLKASKMWAWEGDPLVKALCEAYKIAPVSLPITDVLTSLQTGLVDSFYAPPLAAIALQWFTKVKYMTTQKLSNATGAMVLRKNIYNQLSPQHQKTLKEVSRKYSKMIIETTRRDNEKSYAVLKKQGIQFVSIPESDFKEIQKTSAKVQQALIGKLYPKSLLEKVLSLIQDHRSKKNSKKVSSSRD